VRDSSRSALAATFLLSAATPAAAAPGDLDPSFSDDGWDTQNVFNDDCARDAAIQPDGKIVVVGGCDGFASDTFSVMRYLPSGEPDQGFGTDGEVNVPFDTCTSIPTNEQAFVDSEQRFPGPGAVPGPAALHADGRARGRFRDRRPARLGSEPRSGRGQRPGGRRGGPDRGGRDGERRG
jgi:Domain of unknown function (DUF5122) beta-propeller